MPSNKIAAVALVIDEWVEHLGLGDRVRTADRMTVAYRVVTALETSPSLDLDVVLDDQVAAANQPAALHSVRAMSRDALATLIGPHADEVQDWAEDGAA